MVCGWRVGLEPDVPPLTPMLLDDEIAVRLVGIVEHGDALEIRFAIQVHRPRGDEPLAAACREVADEAVEPARLGRNRGVGMCKR